jgi:hypothetical protein
MDALKDDGIPTKEIESWKGFEYALRQPNATLFNKMLTECLENEEYAAAFKSKGPQDSVESLFMALILQQQKMINKLIEKYRTVKRRKSEGISVIHTYWFFK